MLVAEELDCDWSQMRVEHAPAAPAYAHPAFGMQMTGGSSTTWSRVRPLSPGGAMARDMLVRAAAAEWQVAPSECRTENGAVVAREQALSYGALATKAQKLSPPGEVTLKASKDWKIIGKPTKRLDSPEKVVRTRAVRHGRALPGPDDCGGRATAGIRLHR